MDDEEFLDDRDGAGEGGDWGAVLARGVLEISRQRIGIWRQIVGQYALQKGLRELQEATPRSSRPDEYPGIRSYYDAAKGLNGLQVRTNWAVTPVRVDVDDAKTAFVITEVTNPHPGAHVLMFGTRGPYSQSAHIENPEPKEWPRKTARRSSKPRMMTTWQSLAGGPLSFHPSPFLHDQTPAKYGFADQVYAIAQRWGTYAAEQAFGAATATEPVLARTTIWMAIGGKKERGSIIS